VSPHFMFHGFVFISLAHLPHAEAP
jgi:hypothetical protein